jgi:hypothetical protein
MGFWVKVSIIGLLPIFRLFKFTENSFKISLSGLKMKLLTGFSKS